MAICFGIGFTQKENLIIASSRIGMSLFSTEEFHAVVPAEDADGGGPFAPQGHPSSPLLDISPGDGRPPGSSGKSRLTATSQFG